MDTLILADDRQPVEVNRGLEKLGYKVVARQLATADYVWTVPGGRAGAEVKSMADLLRSHKDGRLDEQLYRLTRGFRMPFLVAMGIYDTDIEFPEHSGWNSIAADNMFIGRQMQGVLVARSCLSYDDLPERLDKLIRYSRKRKDEGPRHRAYIFSRPALEPKEEVLYALLASVRGVRDKTVRCQSIAKRASLTEIFKWEEKEWVEAGFTKPMARKIVARTHS